MRQLSDGIKAVFMREGISAREDRVKQGPMTITFQLSLSEASRRAVASVKNLGGAIEQATGYGPVVVSMTPRDGVFIIFPSPDAFTPPARVLAEETKKANIVVGMDPFDEPVYLNLVQMPNLLVIGPPLSGKTNAVRTLLYQVIPQGIEYIIVAERMVSWQVFTKLSGCIGVYSSAEAGLEVLQNLEKQMEERAQHSTQFTPRVMVILDDLMSLLKAQPALADTISRLVTAGGQVGIMVVMATQMAGTRDSTGGTKVENAFNAKLVYRMPGSLSAYLAAGTGGTGVDKLTGLAGDALLIRGNQEFRCATGWATDDDLLSELPPYRGRSNEFPAFVFTPPTQRKVLPPTIPAPAQIETRVEEVRDESLPVGLPVIKPARVPTEEEVQQIIRYLKHNPLSQTQLLRAVYGDKSGPYRDKMRNGFGNERWLTYFPTKFV